MNTSKPVSCILWNDLDLTIKHANELLNQGYISFWCFIYHYAESFEGKDHIHFYCEPDKKISTTSLSDVFTDVDLINPDLPIRPARWVSSKFNDWYLYVLHDIDYLKSKGLVRKYHYSDKDFYYSSDVVWNELIHNIDRSKLNGSKITQLIDFIQNGKTFPDIVSLGFIPVQQIHQYKEVYDLLVYYLKEKS